MLCGVLNFAYVLSIQVLLFLIFLVIITHWYLSNFIHDFLETQINYVIDSLYDDIITDMTTTDPLLDNRIKKVIKEQIDKLEDVENRDQFIESNYPEIFVLAFIFIALTMGVVFIGCLSITETSIEIISAILLIIVICVGEYIILDKVIKNYIFINLSTIRKSIGKNIIDYVNTR